MADRDLSTLPKWAQDRIRNLEASVESWRKLAQGEHPISRHRVLLGYTDGAKPIEASYPDDNQFRIYPEASDSRTYFEFQVIEDGVQVRLSTSTGTGHISVMPEHSNGLTLRAVDRYGILKGLKFSDFNQNR